MNTLFPSLSVETQARCWCGNTALEGFSPDYWRCAECETLVVRAMRGEEITRITDDEHDFYGKGYYLHHVQEDYGLPDLETRARADLPERCLHWLRTMLKFVPGAGARTLELGCGHGGFVAMQRWAGLEAAGLELSPWLVDKAREWFGVPVLQGRLEDQDLPAASYDAVVLMDVLEHLPDPRQTLGRAVSLLRPPGGFLLIQTPCYPAGMSYETLRAQDHAFLTQLKPVEHLHLFSERALARLCAEIGIGQVRFEPAIFAHYDLFAVASANALQERSQPERTRMLMAASPPARWTLALLDLGEVRDGLAVRLAASVEEGADLRRTIERRHEEIGRLEGTLHELWPKLEAADHARNLLAAQLNDLQRHFTSVEADRAARLEVIETQGTEISRLQGTLHELWPRLEAADHARNLLAAQLDDLRGHFERGEADRAARLEVIETQGAEIGRLQRAETEGQSRLEQTLRERDQSAAQLAEAHAGLARGGAEAAGQREIIANHEAVIIGLQAQLTSAEGERDILRQRKKTLDAHWTAWLLKRLRFWPLD